MLVRLSIIGVSPCFLCFPPRCPPKSLGAPSVPSSPGESRLRRTLSEAHAPRTTSAVSISTRPLRSRVADSNPASMAVGTVGRAQTVILKIVKSAGAQPAEDATVQRGRRLLRLDGGGALRLFCTRIGWQHECRGNNRRSYDAHQTAHDHVLLPQSSSSRFTAGAAGFLNLSQSLVRPER